MAMGQIPVGAATPGMSVSPSELPHGLQASWHMEMHEPLCWVLELSLQVWLPILQQDWALDTGPRVESAGLSQDSGIVTLKLLLAFLGSP